MSAVAKNKVGRPSKYTPELVTEICERLSKGEPLAAICREPRMPGCRTVYDWADADEVISAAIARARDEGEEAIAVDCLTIADDVEEHPASRKVRVDTRLKLLAKWNPKRWGDKLQHADADGEKLPPTTINVYGVTPG